MYAYIRDPIMIYFLVLINRQTIKYIIVINDVYLLLLTTKKQTFPLSDTNGIKGCAYKEIIKISAGNMYTNIVGLLISLKIVFFDGFYACY